MLKPSALLLLLCSISFILPVHADESPQAPPTDQACTQGEGQYHATVKSRYGTVNFDADGGNEIQFNGKLIPQVDSVNSTGDTIIMKKSFRLGDADVYLASGIYLGNTTETPDLDFLLVIRPRVEPQIVELPDGNGCPIWQKGNALYIGGAKDACGNRLPVFKFENGKLGPGNKPKPACQVKPQPFPEADCEHEFKLMQRLCTGVGNNSDLDCANDANDDSAWLGGASLAERGNFNSAVGDQYFDTKKFNALCSTWCSKGTVTYKQYHDAECMKRMPSVYKFKKKQNGG